MIHTSDSNYAIYNENLLSNWRTVSVNGDDVTIATRDNQLVKKPYASLSQAERNSLASIKNTLTSVIRLGPFSVKSSTGLAKLTTFDRNGGSSSMGTGGGSSSSSSSSSSGGGGSSIQKTGPNSFIISKQNFPFNWHRVFVNDDIATIVYRNGKVVMLPEGIIKADERQKVAELRQEVQQSAKAAEQLQQQISSSFKNPMDFVNNALGGIFGR